MLIDVFHKRGKSAGKRLVESRAKESVNHHGACLKLGRVELLRYFEKTFDALMGGHQLPVFGTVGRKMAADVEQVDAHLVVLVGQHSCHGQCVAAVVARSCKHHEGRGVAPALGDGKRQRTGSALHQIER